MIDLTTTITCTVLGLIAGIGVGVHLTVIVAELIGKAENKEDAAGPIRTVSVTVGGRIIEKRGNVPISSTATCSGRY